MLGLGEKGDELAVRSAAGRAAGSGRQPLAPRPQLSSRTVHSVNDGDSLYTANMRWRMLERGRPATVPPLRSALRRCWGCYSTLWAWIAPVFDVVAWPDLS